MVFKVIAGITLARALIFPLLPKVPAIGLPNSRNIVRSLPALAYRLEITEGIMLYPIPRSETTRDMILAERKSEKVATQHTHQWPNTRYTQVQAI
jgi:hypothetical protein